MKFTVDDLVAKKLVTKKTYTDGPFAGLSVLKYKNNVFWDNLWDTDPRLLECRGMVVDSDDNVVIWPFTKIFNRFENGTDLPLDKNVVCIRKINGFMATAAIRNDKLLVSTTGTLDSEFSNLARKYLENMDFSRVSFPEDYTFIFEICDKSDPHIVEEKEGAYLIGARDLALNGVMVEEGKLDRIAEVIGAMRPEWHIVPFGDVVYNVKHVNHEGYVIRNIGTDDENSELLLKIKSPHYLAKKFLMRGGDNKWDMIWDQPHNAKQRIDEEYYELLDHIREYYTKEAWSVMDSQQRRKVVEDYFTIEDLFDRGSRFYVGVAR
uniref:RNA ligase and tail fiber protein attachment catalyst n=1 Tax=Salmonella phage vB_SEnST11_KE23 TaxID=3161174 RepID=A0AAU8GGI2_9CAUD